MQPAVIYAVTLAWSSGLGGETCTDKLRVWGIGANVVRHDRLGDITFYCPRLFTTTAQNNTTYTDRLRPTQQILKSIVGSLWECKGSFKHGVKFTRIKRIKKSRNQP